MTFVAHPYERFVDDLMTALTGGVIREEHLFQGIDRPYVLAQPGAVAASLRVFGQRGQAYAVFEQGIDYRYGAEDHAVLWQTDGGPPDAHSHFYVSYYVDEGQPRLTDRNPGSVVSVLAGGFGRELAILHRQMQMIYESAFVDLATNSSLDHVAALLALTRRDARFAVGEVLFKRATPAEGDIFIPPGTLVSTEQGYVFETTVGRTLRRGQLSIVTPVRAQVEGQSGLVEANRISILNRPIFGIETIVNEQATAFAAERETDDELRRRIRGTLERAGRSTLESIRLGLVENVPQLTAAEIQVSEDPRAPGLVEVRLGIAAEADDELVRRVDEAILDARAAGVRVRHNLRQTPAPAPAATDGVTRPAVLADFQAIGSPFPADRAPAAASPDDATLALQVEVLLALSKPRLTVAEHEEIEDGVRREVAEYVRQLPMGGMLIHNKLLARILGSDEVADASLLVRPKGAGEDSPRYTKNLEAPDQKLTLDPADVFVELMQQIVELDVLVQLEPLAPRPAPNGSVPAPDGGAPIGPPELTPALRDAVRQRVESAVAASRPIVRDQLRAAVQALLAEGGAPFVPAEQDAVVLRVRYVETGRLLDNPAEVALEEHELASVHDLKVDLRGALDA